MSQRHDTETVRSAARAQAFKDLFELTWQGVCLGVVLATFVLAAIRIHTRRQSPLVILTTAPPEDAAEDEPNG